MVSRKNEKIENYFVFKFNPRNEDHDWNISKGIKCLKERKTEYWSSPIPCNPAPKKGDKVILWESSNFYIRGVATVVRDKEKSKERGYRVWLKYEKLFKSIPYTEKDAIKGGMLECFNEIKGKNDQRSKKLISIDFNPDKLYKILLNKSEYVTSEKNNNEEIDDNRKRKSEDNDGSLGEHEVYKLLVKKFGKNNVQWVSSNAEKFGVIKSRDGDDRCGYDIKYKDNGIFHFVEVKSSVYESESFFISSNELETALISEELYHLYVVKNVGKKSQKITNLGNVFIRWGKGDFTDNDIFIAEPVSYKISLK